MPGTVLAVRVKEGEVIVKGQPLIVLSAMKMEMVVQAPIGGRVKKICVEKDKKLEGDDLVMEIVPVEEEPVEEEEEVESLKK